MNTIARARASLNQEIIQLVDQIKAMGAKRIMRFSSLGRDESSLQRSF